MELLAKVGSRSDRPTIRASFRAVSSNASPSRAFASRPKVLFADEPTGNLDTVTGARSSTPVVRSQRRLRHDAGAVTHDARLADRCDRDRTRRRTWSNESRRRPRESMQLRRDRAGVRFLLREWRAGELRLLVAVRVLSRSVPYRNQSVRRSVVRLRCCRNPRPISPPIAWSRRPGRSPTSSKRRRKQRGLRPRAP